MFFLVSILKPLATSKKKSSIWAQKNGHFRSKKFHFGSKKPPFSSKKKFNLGVKKAAIFGQKSSISAQKSHAIKPLAAPAKKWVPLFSAAALLHLSQLSFWVKRRGGRVSFKLMSTFCSPTDADSSLNDDDGHQRPGGIILVVR